MKKGMTLIIAAFMALAVFAGLPAGTANAETEPSSNALFLKSARMVGESGGTKLTFTFDKSAASAEKDVTAEMGASVIVNGKKLAEISGATLGYKADGSAFLLTASLPESALTGKSDKVILSSGFVSETNFITTVRYIYTFEEKLGAGTRVYRSDDMNDYEGVSVTSVSVPETQSSNFNMYIYFSENITGRKLIDMSVRDMAVLKSYHGDGPNTDHMYTNAEIDLYHQYGIMGYDKKDSLLYKIQFGADSYNGLKAFPGNNSNKPYDMTSQGKVNGLDVYTLFQVQEQVCDNTHYYFDTTKNQVINNGSSQQNLAVQVHMEGNHIQIVLKGDSARDDLMSEIYDADKKKLDVDSFRENILPSKRENLALTLKAGMLFPNGKMLKQDAVFSYNATKKMWYVGGSSAGEPAVDDTLGNQEGYTDEELAAKNPASGGGCSGKTSAAAVAGLCVALAAVKFLTK